MENKNKKICGEVVLVAARPIGGGRGYRAAAAVSGGLPGQRRRRRAPRKTRCNVRLPVLSAALGAKVKAVKGKRERRTAKRVARQTRRRRAEGVRRCEEEKRSNAMGGKDDGRKGPEIRASWLCPYR